MPQISRYSDEQVEALLTEITAVLEKQHTPVDLSLMVLGNMITNLINTSVASELRRPLVRSFTEALNASVSENKDH